MTIKEKLQNVFAKPINKYAIAVGAGSSIAAASFNVFAADPVTDGAAAAEQLLNAMTATLNLQNMVTIITAGIGAVLALYLGWWGARKLARMLMGVFNKGRIRF
jgi:p-aminobenzoyl-glutamate transporter AbgT